MSIDSHVIPRIGRGPAGTACREGVRGSSRPETTGAPLSDAQQRLWFLYRLNGPTAEYNLSAATRLIGALDVKAFRRAVTAVVERHAVLRTRFSDAGAEPCQIIEPHAAVDMPIDDLSGASGEAVRDLVAEAQHANASDPFDLERGPLLRMRILRLGPREHIVLRTVHHIIWDALSLRPFLNDLAAFYNAFATGTEPLLPALPLQFADFAAWQHDTRDRLDHWPGLAYWKRQLNGCPECLDLPADRPRSAARTTAASVYEVTVVDDLGANLAALARAHHATVYMVLLAAYAALLARYSGQDDIVVGSPVTNRSDVRLEKVIGFFTNVVPLRLHVRHDSSMNELIEAARTVVLDAIRHQDVPFERIVEAVAPYRGLGMLPICQVLLTLPNKRWTPPNLVGLESEFVPSAAHSSRYDLELYVSLSGRELTMRWLSNAALFDDARIARMAQHFRAVLAFMVRDDTTTVGELTLSADDRSPAPAAAARAHSGGTLVGMFESQAARTPHALAVACGAASMTYRELNGRANQFARVLIDRGIGPEDRVGVLVGRSCDMVAAMLGVWKCAAAFVPLAADHPAQRLAAIVTEAAPRLVIVDEAAARAIADGARLLELDSLAVQTELARAPRSNPSDRDRRSGLCPECAAYVLYTSGSTGEPKGVIVEHRSLTTFVRAMARHCRFAAGDRHVAVTTITFDISVLELFMPLCYGAAVIVAEADVVRDPAQLALLARRESATSLQATPSHWSGLRRSLADLGLRTVMVGGETLPSDLASEMVATGASVVNLYGPTEATIWASVHKVSERDVAEGSPAAVSIGRPLEGYAMYVLDARCLAVPDGAVGELHIAGAGLARGYLKRPGWTAERFLPDPFGSRGGRMYRTGDLARRRADGALEFMGRCDHQVKVRGFRIELGEIETALRRHGCVQDAAVVIHGEGDLKRLAAFVILQPNGVPGDSAPANAPAEEGPQSAHLEGVRQYLREQLPDYMIPATITVLDAWPLTPSGKLNRKALPVPSLATTRPTTQSPETEQERAISVLFAEVLGLKEVSLDDDFFELGGHSMLAMRLTNYMRSFLGVELSIRELFKAPTVRLLARHVSHLPLPS